MSEQVIERVSSGGMPASMHETAVSAVATQARAMVEARFVVAMNRPRDVDDFRSRLLKDCQRPGFAEVAIYSLPRGKQKIEGPSIRFLEAALRAWGNSDSMVHVIFEDDEKLLIRVTVTDLETNATYASEHRISKTMERRELRKGQKALGERENSYGDTVYLVPATDDDLAMKINAAASRAIRTNGLRLIPGDIVEEALDQVRATQQKKDAADPDAARKKVADAFSAIGVMPADLREYLGHPLDQCSPAELADLRAVYASVRDGAATWAELMEAKRKSAGDTDRDETLVDEKDLAKVEKVADERAKKLGDESITGSAIVAAVCAEAKLESAADILKADLPAALKRIAGWNPPVGGGEPKQEELPA